MFHEYDLEEIHRDVENSLPRIPNGFSSTTNLTKMNVIVPIIPEPTREIMDFTLLVAGVSLNTLLGLVIVFNSATRTSLNCYIMSLVCSNVAILLEPLQQVLRWTFRTGLSMNLDYIFLVTFDVSALTIILLNIETYVVVCQKNSPLRAPLLKVSTAVKAVSCVWTMCITLTAMELHMYDHFEEEVMYDICMSSTVMFLIAPCFIFIMLDCFILYELILSKSTDGEWPGEDTERFVLLGERAKRFFVFACARASCPPNNLPKETSTFAYSRRHPWISSKYDTVQGDESYDSRDIVLL